MNIIELSPYKKPSRAKIQSQIRFVIKTLFLSTEISVINSISSSNHDDLPSGKIRLGEDVPLIIQRGVIFNWSDVKFRNFTRAEKRVRFSPRNLIFIQNLFI